MRIRLAGVLATLTIVLPTLGSAHLISAAPSSAPTHQDRLLYSWKLPARGHAGDWRVQNHVAIYDGSANGAVFAPYKLKSGMDFAIQAQLRGVGPGPIGVNLPGFGIVVRTVASNPHTSVAGGLYFTGSDDNGPQIYWNGQTVGGNTLDPGTSWHTYRFAVQGDIYTLSIDGKTMVQYNVDAYPNPTRAGVFGAFYGVRMRNFQIFSVGPATSQIPTAPELQRFNVTAADMPTDELYAPYLQHWFTNQETARARKVSLSAVQASGRIISYETDFYSPSQGIDDVYSAVTAYQTADDAHADLPVRVNTVTRGYRSDSRCPSVTPLPTTLSGDTSGGVAVECHTLGITVRFVILYAVRSHYLITTEVTAGTGTTLAQDEAMAVGVSQIVDGRIRQG